MENKLTYQEILQLAASNMVMINALGDKINAIGNKFDDKMNLIGDKMNLFDDKIAAMVETRNQLSLKAEQEMREMKEFQKESAARSEKENQEFRESLRKASVRSEKENQEFRESLREASARSEKENQEFRESLREASARSEKENQELREYLEKSLAKSEKETQEIREMQRIHLETANLRFQRSEEQLIRLMTTVSGIGNNQGADAENFFYNALVSNPVVADNKFDEIRKGMRIYISDNQQGEYDIVLINCSVLMVVEVKYHLHLNDVVKFYERQLPKFKILFPDYKDYQILAAVASFSHASDALSKAQECGLYILSRAGADIKMLNPANFTPIYF